ncbi:MAG TPA: tripartite tricarboxylate transporter substrate binding protein [Piscinibacter sp.]|nr:tripartite tricarboxylate transporter substrate binding protein [Piscinibacter sp.]
MHTQEQVFEAADRLAAAGADVNAAVAAHHEGNAMHSLSSSRRGLLLAASGLALAPLARAQAYPSRPVRLVVPFTPGGAVDIYARTVQAALAENLGQPIVIENRTGASGMIGAEAVAKAAPDGYTLLVGNVATLAMNAAIYTKMPYDPVKDLTPVMQTVVVNYVLVVNPEVPARNVAELIAYARANPGKLTYGSSGSGSAQHMAAELFKARTGTQITHVPYKGTGALVGDLIAGHVHMIFADQGSMMPHVKAGKLRALGVGGLQRSPEYPDIPTVAEAGNLPGFEAVGWQGIAAPAGLPAPILARVHAAFQQVHAQPGMREKLAAAGLTSVANTPAEFGRYIQAEITKWTKVAKDVGATVD